MYIYLLCNDLTSCPTCAQCMLTGHVDARARAGRDAFDDALSQSLCVILACTTARLSVRVVVGIDAGGKFATRISSTRSRASPPYREVPCKYVRLARTRACPVSVFVVSDHYPHHRYRHEHLHHDRRFHRVLGSLSFSIAPTLPSSSRQPPPPPS